MAVEEEQGVSVSVKWFGEDSHFSLSVVSSHLILI